MYKKICNFLKIILNINKEVIKKFIFWKFSKMSLNVLNFNKIYICYLI